MKQLKSVSLNFNLREPKGKKQTPIYAILRANGKQCKIPLGLKIEPWLWDARRQQPVLTSGNENILHIIKIISDLKLGFLRKDCYDCSKDIISKFRQENEMANPQKLRHSVTRTPQATTQLRKAFNLYYKEKQVKKSTITETSKLLKSYYEYCKATGKDTIGMLSQRGLNEYRDYLVKQRSSSNMRINSKCELVARLTNFMVGHTDFERYHLQPVKYSQLQEFKPKGEDKLRRPLTDNELQAIANCEGLTPHEAEYRDLFLVQCECGCRASDLWKVFDDAQQEHYTKDGQDAVVINTLKENIKAVIMLTPLIKLMQNKYEHGWRINVKGKVSVYNAALKRIFCRAGLSTIEQYTDAYGVQQQRPLHEVINSHFARYTFVRRCLDRGLTSSEIKDMTGHADETMVNEVYAVITAKDKAANAFKALERVSDKPLNNDAANEQQQSIALTDYVLRCRDILSWLGEPRESYVGISHPQELARLITAKYEVPLVNMGWTIETIEHLYKSNDIQGYERLKADIMKLRLHQ